MLTTEKKSQRFAKLIGAQKCRTHSVAENK